MECIGKDGEWDGCSANGTLLLSTQHACPLLRVASGWQTIFCMHVAFQGRCPWQRWRKMDGAWLYMAWLSLSLSLSPMRHGDRDCSRVPSSWTWPLAPCPRRVAYRGPPTWWCSFFCLIGRVARFESRVFSFFFVFVVSCFVTFFQSVQRVMIVYRMSLLLALFLLLGAAEVCANSNFFECASCAPANTRPLRRTPPPIVLMSPAIKRPSK